MNASRPGRTTREYECLNCGRRFHPVSASSRKYCSIKCAAAAHSERQQRARAAREAAQSGSHTPEQILAILTAQPTKPRPVPDEEEAQP